MLSVFCCCCFVAVIVCLNSFDFVLLRFTIAGNFNSQWRAATRHWVSHFFKEKNKIYQKQKKKKRNPSKQTNQQRNNSFKKTGSKAFLFPIVKYEKKRQPAASSSKRDLRLKKKNPTTADYCKFFYYKLVNYRRYLSGCSIW